MSRKPIASSSTAADGGLVTPDLTETMYKMASFRNVVVHGYQSLDRRILRDIVEHRLGDLLAFVQAIRVRASA